MGAIICAAVPAFRIRRATLSINLRDGGRSDTAGKTRQRLRATIAALQIAVALVVSTGSALLLRTFYQLYQERSGFDATNVMTIWTQLPFARYGDSSSVKFYARLTDAVAKLPDRSRRRPHDAPAARRRRNASAVVSCRWRRENAFRCPPTWWTTDISRP